jgi:hypothetical protein
MEQQVIIRFFPLNGLKAKAKAIHSELVSMYDEDTLALSTMKKWHKRFSRGWRDPFDDPRSERRLAHDLAETIHSPLEERSFTSCKILCRHFRIGKAKCLRILHDSPGLKDNPSSHTWCSSVPLASHERRGIRGNVLHQKNCDSTSSPPLSIQVWGLSIHW